MIIEVTKFTLTYSFIVTYIRLLLCAKACGQYHLQPLC